MSTANLTNTCAVCGAEESLDALLLRMIDDDTVRRLIADVLTMSLPMGGLVVRYLRLHKPPKQRLRMSTIGKLLAELVPDVQRTAIERKGRMWVVSPEAWKAAFQVVFDAADKGTLTLPLEGNAYLYGVLVRLVDRHEASVEQQREQGRRHRAQESTESAMPEPAAVGVRQPAQEDAPDPEAAAKAALIRQKLKDALAAKKAGRGAEEQP